MKLSTDTDVTAFVPEQQDALLAEMQAEALRVFQNAATAADSAAATTAFAQAATARNTLSDLIAQRRASCQRLPRIHDALGGNEQPDPPSNPSQSVRPQRHEFED